MTRTLPIQEIIDRGYTTATWWGAHPPKHYKFHLPDATCGGYRTKYYSPPSYDGFGVVRWDSNDTMEACSRCFPYGVKGSEQSFGGAKLFYASSDKVPSNGTAITLFADSAAEAVDMFLQLRPEQLDEVYVWELSGPTVFVKEKWVAK